MANKPTKVRMGFTFYRSFRDAIRMLDDQDQLTIYRAIDDYALDQQQPDLDRLSIPARICWVSIRPNLDANIARYNNGCRPKTTSSAAKPKRKPSNHEANSIIDDNDNDNVNVNDNVNEDESESMTRDLATALGSARNETEVADAPAPRSRLSSRSSNKFTPPTADEVRDYIACSGLSADADAFVDYYTANGWCVGHMKMRDWRAAVRNWARRDYPTRSQPELSLCRPIYNAL